MTTLLIIDDSSEMRWLVRQIAAESCDRVFECEGDDRVLEAFDSRRPDWVLMDVETKRTDQLNVTPALMRLHPEVKVINMTKYTDAETRSAVRETGARFFVGQDDLLSLRSLIREH